MHEGENPADRDDTADRPWRRHAARVQRFRPNWLEGKVDPAATTEMLAAPAQANEDEAADKVVELINREVAPQAIWDALLLQAGELLVRQPGIVALHAVTSTNALHFAWQTTDSDDTRRMLLLQNASFLSMFREAMSGRGEIKSFQLDELQPVSLAAAGQPAVEEIFADVSGDRMQAAGKVLAYVQEHPRSDRADRRRARAGVSQRKQRPRLQVQLGRVGRLSECLARVAREIPGLERVQPAWLWRCRQPIGAAHRGGRVETRIADRSGRR